MTTSTPRSRRLRGGDQVLAGARRGADAHRRRVQQSAVSESAGAVRPERGVHAALSLHPA
jgi:hypothetical protein